MRCISILVVLLLSPNIRALENDKRLHLVSTMFISGAVSSYYKSDGDSSLNAASKGIYIASLIGFIKEANDERFDFEDMKYNLIGSIIGSFAVWEF